MRLAQTEEAAKRAALASYGGPRAPPGAAKLYEAEQARLVCTFGCAVRASRAHATETAPRQRAAELTTLVVDLRRKLAREREAAAAAQRETKARTALDAACGERCAALTPARARLRSRRTRARRWRRRSARRAWRARA